MKKTLLSFALLGLMNAFGSECNIITSPLDYSSMRFGYSNWNAYGVPIVDTKDFKYTSFVDAYSEFDTSTRKYIKETVCKKQKWDGVANYKIQWQITDKRYSFIATFDAFAKK